MKIPLSTYRLQLNKEFNFQKASELAEYLSELGVSHFYVSPLLKAKPNSMHGYDIVDHSELNPEIGTDEEFETLIKTLRKYNMGMICDIVPNHMNIAHSSNKWWNDVLENGPSSPYAEYFDIDWHPPHKKMNNKVLLPLLDQQYGEALEAQSLKIILRDGSFILELPFTTLPLDPKSWNLILEPVVTQMEKSLPVDHHELLELKSIVTAIAHLPGATDLEKEKVDERQREKEVIKHRLQKLINHSDPIHHLIQAKLDHLNGLKGDPRSFDSLENLLNNQSYRLCYWRVANDEINYRRFSDIIEFAGICTEKPHVFEAVHAFIFHYIQKDFIEGIRIDHIDGLIAPRQYLQDLQAHCTHAIKSVSSKNPDEPFYIVVEKILIGNEKLRSDWPISGSVGYEFLNQVNGLFVNQSAEREIKEIYRNFTDVNIGTLELLYVCKKLILLGTMSSELHVLSRHLVTIADQHRSSRDFTSEGLRAALGEVIACFPVYRSYINPGHPISEEDQNYILTAVSQAKHRNPNTSGSIFDFIQEVLLLTQTYGLADQEKKKRENFVLRFQQLTPPIMVKGLEDTSFYRRYPLTSLNEVGMDPFSFGISVENFHKKNLERFEKWPHSLIATSTHDTKRSEDVRARINVLSEIPQEWSEKLTKWSKINKEFMTQEGDDPIPDRNEEYLFYQTLVGTWPLGNIDAAEHLQYSKRIQNYMEKAIKEAKIHTSWINPNKRYEQEVHQFIEKVLNLDTDKNPFIKEIKQFIPKIAAAGMLNSLSQVLIKCISPGVPDFYQGSELWDFSLVDPDNRRPIDYEIRKYLIKNLSPKEGQKRSDFLKAMLEHPEDGRIKLFVTLEALQLRKKFSEVFLNGSYIPLVVKGSKDQHLIAFARNLGSKVIIAIATRFFMPLLKQEIPLISPKLWKGTVVELPEELRGHRFKNVFTQEEIVGSPEIELTQILDPLSIALLESTP